MNEQPLAPPAKEDRRTRRTKKMLRNGLSVLLQTKSLKDISVRELTELVDLHRGTFYVHYRDIYDLYANIEAEVVEEFNAILDAYSPAQITDRPTPLILAMINYIYDNADICLMLLGDNGNRRFVDNLAGAIRDRCINDWIMLDGDTPPRQSEYGSCYVVSGCIGIIRMWVEHGMSESPQQIAEIIERMSVPSVVTIRTG